MDEKNPVIPDGLRKAMEETQKITDSVSPIIEQQEKLKDIIKPLTVDIPTFDNPVKDVISNTALKELSKTIVPKEYSLVESIGKSALGITNALSNYKIDFGISAAVQALNSTFANSVAKSFQTMIGNMTSALLEVAKSPFIQWIQTVDFSPFVSILKNLDLDKFDSERYKRLSERFLTSMYMCKWFPYAGWNADISVFTEVNEILNSSRGISKRCESRIDKIILGYYTKDEIKQIKREWRNSDLEPHIKKILGQALEAHLRGEYVLSISCLSTMWEGLIQKKSNIAVRQKSKLVKQNFKSLIEENEQETIFSDFYETFIVCDCNTVDDVIDGIPNRNGVSHSKYKKYPNKKASLNAILLTDFIIKLHPKKDTEEKTNGQDENADAE